MFETILGLINSIIIGPLIEIVKAVGDFFKISKGNDPQRRYKLRVQTFFIVFLFALIFFIIYFKPLNKRNSDTGSNQTPISIEGFYESSIEDESGNSKYMTLTIKEKEISSEGNNLECTILDSEKMRFALGRFDSENFVIYIPGLGSGRVKGSQNGEVILKFHQGNREIQFSK